MTTIAIRVDDKLKAEAVELFDSLGLDMTTAIKMFLIQSVQTKSIPFSVKQNISDKDFQEMVEKKIPSVKVSAGDKESLAAFFGDEDFSEYGDVFNG
jgi:addiction module antitoxin, relB/dinJ family